MSHVDRIIRQEIGDQRTNEAKRTDEQNEQSK